MFGFQNAPQNNMQNSKITPPKNIFGFPNIPLNNMQNFQSIPQTNIQNEYGAQSSQNPS